MTLSQDISLLIRVPLFAELGSDHLRLLAFSAVRSELAPGEILFHEGDAAQSGIVVMTGEVELFRGRGGTRESVGRFGPGVLLGETALFTETVRHATAIAVTDSYFMAIERSLMQRMLVEYPQIADQFRTMLAEKLGATLAEIAPVRERLERAVLPRARRG